MPSQKDILIQQEKRISASFLKHSPKETSVDEEEEGILHVFLETVGGVHEIVTSRLYRCEANSLEAYFSSRWGISRAQVYRYMDCYFVLSQLEGFEELPARERLCRSLKKCAKTQDDMRKLWKYTLMMAGDQRPIPTQWIHEAWNLLKKGKKAELQTAKDHKLALSENSILIPHPTSKRLRSSSQNSETLSRLRYSSQDSETLKRLRTPSQGSDTQERHISIDDLLNEAEAEFLVAEGSTLEPETYEPREVQEYLEETTKDLTIDELVKSLFSTMDTLSEMGYKLQPKIDQRWCPTPIKQWRMIPMDIDMNIEVPSLISSSSETFPGSSSDFKLEELE